MKYNFHKKIFIEKENNPDKIAIAGSDKDITWLELEERTERLASQLTLLHISDKHPVVIYGHKETAFAAAILACIHATVAYVPIDKIYPIDRIKKIVEITNSKILINCTENTLDVPFAVVFNATFEMVSHEEISFSELSDSNSDDPLQYIMFTSGSTGEPKGVQITKNATLTFIEWSTRHFGFSGEDVFLNQAPFTFDVSLCDIFNAFALGASLVLTSTEIIKSQELFLERIKKYGCTVWTSTPSFAFLFLRNSDFNITYLPTLKSFLFMGEELPVRTCKILKSQFPGCRIMNAYGPTEATIVTTFIELLDEHLENKSTVPIGFPMPESELIINKINSGDKEGELIICGNHVSTGYYKNESATREKFFIHNGKRAFRTGDIAYYENDILYFVGRNDDQIKLHGFRIELQEISTHIADFDFVQDAITIPLKRDHEVKKIITFIKTGKNQIPSNFKDIIFSILSNKIPYYMIPSDIIAVEEFPYSSSHKADKKKLAEWYIQNQL